MPERLTIWVFLASSERSVVAKEIVSFPSIAVCSKAQLTAYTLGSDLRAPDFMAT